MKNLCLIIIFLCISKSYSQQYVTWNPVNNGVQVTGLDLNGNVVTATNTGVGNNLRFDSQPVLVGANNLITTLANEMFSTVGQSANPPSRDLTFTFQNPVIVTRFNIADVDLGNWNDTFIFNGINFTNNPQPIAVNMIATLAGGVATIDVGINAEFASWFCSDPITTFTIDYQTIGGLTTAYLAYSIEVLNPPTINPTNRICLNSIPPSFPVVGNNIVGTWSPSVINSNVIGNTIYTFTPTAGQPIQCPIAMTVTVEDCCIPTLTSNATIMNMIQEERSNWISSSDIITFSGGAGQGVVYHAGNFVELTPGFDAVFGSQFAAYPQGCTGNFTYKNTKPIEKDIFPKEEVFINSKKPSILNLYSENEILKISLINLYANNLTIISLDGKTLYQDNSNEKDYYEIDISNYAKGIYIVSTIIGNGEIYSEKFIKN